MKPGYTNINLSVPIELWHELKAEYEKFPKMWAEMFHMFAAFIGETPDFGVSITTEFPLITKVIDAMQKRE